VVGREAAFWDSSALVPLCAQEPNSLAAEENLRRSSPVVWWAAAVEISSAIARSLRRGSIDSREAREALASMDRLRWIWQEISSAMLYGMKHAGYWAGIHRGRRIACNWRQQWCGAMPGLQAGYSSAATNG
jgi:hypothetical protein